MIAGFRASQIYFWRLLPIGVAIVFVGALTFLIAFYAAEGGLRRPFVIEFVIGGAPMSVFAAFLMLVPMALVWKVAFLYSHRLFSGLQRRATFSSGISALTGVALFAQLTGGFSRTVFVLLPASMLPVFVAMILTWNTFENVTVEEN